MTTCATCETTDLPDPADADDPPRPTAPTTRSTRSRRVLAAVLIDALCGGAFLPLVFLYVSATTTLPVTQIGVVLSVGGLVGLLLNPVAGILVDRVGAGRTVLAANVVAAVGFVGLLRVSSVVQLALAVAVVSLGQRLYWSAWPVFVAGEVPAGASLDRWFGVVNAVKSAAIGVGSAGAAVLLALGGPGDLRLLVVLAVLGSLVCAALIRPLVGGPAASDGLLAPTGATTSPAPGRDGWAAVLHDRLYLGLTLAHTALTFAWLMLGLALPMYLVEALGLPGWLPSAALALNTALVVLLQLHVTTLLARWRRSRAVLLGTGAFVAAFTLLPLAGLVAGAGTRPGGGTGVGPGLLLTACVVALAVSVYALGEMAVGPAASALAIELSPVALRGRYSALFQTSWTVSSIVGPMALAVLLSWSPAGLWLVMGLVVGAGGLGFLLAEPHVRGRLRVA